MCRKIFFLLVAVGFLSCSPNNKKTQTTSSKKVVEVRQQEEKPSTFSVSENKQVLFSKGNLQYQASTKTWRFAQNQTEIIGKSNMNLTSTYDGWIDLFAWGTSGYSGIYPETGMYEDIISISNTNYDWGEYNEIQGDDVTSGWRTLTIAEWQYLLFKRPNASNLFGCACIDGLMGLIVLPDNFEFPRDIVFKTLKIHEEGDPESDNSGFDYFININEYDFVTWNRLENKGAVFLPAAGVIHEGKYYLDGSYWSSTCNDYDDDYCIYLGSQAYVDFYYLNNRKDKVVFSASEMYKVKTYRKISVRLVRDVQTENFSTDTLKYVGEGNGLKYYVAKKNIGWGNEVAAESLMSYDEKNKKLKTIFITSTGESSSSVAEFSLRNDIKKHIKKVIPKSDDVLLIETIDTGGMKDEYEYLCDMNIIVKKLGEGFGYTFYKRLLYEDKSDRYFIEPANQEELYIQKNKEKKLKKIITTALVDEYYHPEHLAKPSEIKPILADATKSYYVVGGNINNLTFLSPTRIFFSSDCPIGGCNGWYNWIYDIKENKISHLDAYESFSGIRKEGDKEYVVVVAKGYHEEGGAYWYERLFDFDGRYIRDGDFLYE